MQDTQRQALTFTVHECYAGSITNAPNYGPRLQRELQLLLLQSGRIHLDLNERHTDLEGGQIVLLLPGDLVTLTYYDGEDTWQRWITVSRFEIDDHSLQLLRALPWRITASEPMHQLFDVLVGLQQQDLFGTSQVRHTLTLGAFQLYREDCNRHSDPLHPAIIQVKSLIYERYGQEIGKADFCRAARLSDGHLSRLFKQGEGITPLEYLWRYRLERGVELLRTTDLPIGEISRRCGFKTSYHFARMIKQVKHRTPTQIRERAIQGGITMTHAWKQQYEEQGYIVLKQLFTEQEVETYKEEARRVLADRPKRDNSGVFLGVAAASPLVKKAVSHPKLAEILRELYADDVIFMSDKLVYKNAETDFGSPWHQDYAYWHGSQKISAWIALDDATPENGCLRIVPGSHKSGSTQHGGHEEDANTIGFTNRLSDELIASSTVIDMPARRGDVIVFTDLLYHASYPNESGKDRWALIATYKGASQEDPDYSWAHAAFTL